MYIDDKNICLSCMREISESNKTCICGFDENNFNNKSFELKAGTILKNSILIGKSIGQGGFGITYVGYDINLEVKVAVKEFYLSGYVDRNNESSCEIHYISEKYKELFDKRKSKFIEEARILAKLPHDECIVSVLDYFEENNTAYIVMEFVEGETFNVYCAEKGVITPEKTAEMILPLVKSLEKIHSNNIIHRDIRPENIMVTPEEQLKLLDFGNAREYSGNQDDNTQLVFNPNYAALEQYSVFEQRGPFTDVYGLSGVCFFAITGNKPLEASGRLEKDNYDVLSILNSREKSFVNEVISKGMELEAKDRYQSMGEFADALKSAVLKDNKAIAQPESEKEDEADKKSGDKEKKSALGSIILLGIFIVLLAVVAGLIFYIFKAGKEGEAEPSSVNQGNLAENSSFGQGNEDTINTDQSVGSSATSEQAADEETEFDYDSAERVFLTPPEGVSKEEIDRAYEVINGRLANLCGDYTFIFNRDFDDNHGEIFVPIEAFGGDDPQFILNYFVLNPMKLYVAFDFLNYYEIDDAAVTAVDVEDNCDLSQFLNIDLYTGEIIEREDGEEEKGSIITITLSEEAAKELSTEMGKWYDSRFRVNGKRYNGAEGTSISDLQYEPDPQNTLYYDEEGNIEGLHLAFDFGSFINGSISNLDTTYFRSVEISPDGTTIRCNAVKYSKLLDNKNFGENKYLDYVEGRLKNQACFDFFFDVNISEPVVFENVSQNENNCGKFQRDSSYFRENNIECVDVVWLNASANRGDYIDARKYIMGVLDELETDYAIGRYADTFGIVFRMPFTELGECYYKTINYANGFGLICVYNKDTYDPNYYYGEKRLDHIANRSAITYNDNGSISIKLLVNDKESVNNSGFYDELENANCDNTVYMRLPNTESDILKGQYNVENDTVIFDECSLGEDWIMPESMKDYAELMKVLSQRSALDSSEKGYAGCYLFQRYTNVYYTYDEYINDSREELPSVSSEKRETEISNLLKEELGCEAKIEFAYTGLVKITIEEKLDEELADRAEVYVRTIRETKAIDEDDLYACRYNRNLIVFTDSNGNRLMRIDFNVQEEGKIAIEFYSYLLSEEDCEKMSVTAVELCEKLQDDYGPLGIDVIVRRYDEAGVHN